MKSVMKQKWDEIPLNGLLPKDVKQRMWKNIKQATISKSSHVYKWMAAASVILLVSIGGYHLLKWNSNDTDIVITQTYPNDIRLIRLPDGSRVWVNQNTTIEYDKYFNGTTRNVVLTGEAFFEVVKDSTRPFIITSGSIKTTVLGTSFNIRAYKGISPAVEVKTGTVRVENKNNSVLLTKGDAALYIPTSELLVKEKAKSPEPEYKKTLLDIDGLTLEAVITLLQKDYNFSVTYESEDLKLLKIKGTLGTKQGVTEMLKTLVFALNLNLTQTTDDEYIIHNKVL